LMARIGNEANGGGLPAGTFAFQKNSRHSSVTP
jgi:hypothetical protein